MERPRPLRHFLYRSAGLASLALGAAGVVLPLLPTVPFILLAAFCFARSDARLARRLEEHPAFGPHIAAWRRSRAVSRKGKRAAWAAFASSAAAGLVFLPFPWSLAPIAAAVAGSLWIASLATAGPR
ncbi:MAG TPA: YbaN family protein [Allosphingosinicella sp.]